MLNMSENNLNGKRNKELDPTSKERNLQEYNSNDKDFNPENQSGHDQSQKQKMHEQQDHDHNDTCNCGQ
jgi:hypothetical protein